MKKFKVLLSSLLIMLFVLSGCGTKVDSDGNFSIDSKWTLVEFTVKGKTTNVKDDPMAKLAEDAQPKFECSDGKNCTFSLNHKTHNGVVTNEDDVYRITFDDTYKPFLASIDGNRLTLTNESKTVEIIYEGE